MTRPGPGYLSLRNLKRATCPRPQRLPRVHPALLFGGLAFAARTATRTCAPMDPVFADDIARRCASALENGRLYCDSQRAVVARDQFLAMSHELRTPLAHAKAFASNLWRQDFDLDDDSRRDFLAEVEDETASTALCLAVCRGLRHAYRWRIIAQNLAQGDVAFVAMLRIRPPRRASKLRDRRE
jgi:phospho-acceptor domain-containing protein